MGKNVLAVLLFLVLLNATVFAELTASPGGPYNGFEDLAIPISGTCSDSDKDISDCYWVTTESACSIGAETKTGIGTQNAQNDSTITCTDTGTFTDSLILTGENLDGDTESDMTTVTVVELVNNQPNADAGLDLTVAPDTEVTIVRVCTDPDPEETDEGTLDRCRWENRDNWWIWRRCDCFIPSTGEWEDCTDYDDDDPLIQERQIIADNHNTATITVRCSLPSWIDSQTHNLRLRARDREGDSDTENMRLIIERPTEDFACDFSGFDSSISFANEVPDFSNPMWCSGDACTGHNAILINSGATISDLDFRIHDGSSDWYSAGMMVRVVDAGGSEMFSRTNDVDGAFSSSLAISFSSMDGIEAEEYYDIEVYYKDCSTINATTADAAYSAYTDPEQVPETWILAETRRVLIVPDRVIFFCWNLSNEHDRAFTADWARDEDLDASIIAVGTADLTFFGFSPFNAQCVNGVPAAWNPQFRAILFDEFGNQIDEFGNPAPPDYYFTNAVGLTLQPSFTMPLSSLPEGEYRVDLELKTCPEEGISEEGGHSWAAFFRQYIEEIDTWEPVRSDYPMTVHVVDPNDLSASMTGSDTEFYFPPYEPTSTSIEWQVANETTNPIFGLTLISAIFTGPTGILSTVDIPLTIDPAGGATLVELIESLMVPTEEGTYTYTIDLTYDDIWDLDTIPPKTLTASIQLTLFPPPPDVLIVRDLWVEKTSGERTGSLFKEDNEFFNVMVEIENLSEATVALSTGLSFLEAITNQPVSFPIPDSPQSATISPKDSYVFEFKDIPLRDNAELEVGKNYWIQAEIETPPFEDIVVNNEKNAMLSILKTARQAVPEMVPLLVALVAFAVLFALHRKK